MKTQQRIGPDTGSFTRDDELRRALHARRREIDSSVRGHLASVREERAAGDVRALEDGEVPERDIQEDVELALVQMKVEMVEHIDAALARLDDGLYGRCLECGEDIAAGRLRALPFAVRCLECEDARERQARVRRLRPRSIGALGTTAWSSADGQR